MARAYLELNEVELLEAAATCLRDKLLIRLLFRPGCRVSELVALGEDNVDLAHGMATIVHLKSHISLHCPTCQARLGRTHAFCPGCGAKIEGPLAREQEERRQRVVHLDPDTLRMLKEFIERGGPVQRGDRKLIFGINRNQAWRVVHLAARKDALPDLVSPDTGKRRGVSRHRRAGDDSHACHNFQAHGPLPNVHRPVLCAGFIISDVRQVTKVPVAAMYRPSLFPRTG